ncbi:nicotinate phosphoribosyltransferase [Methylococcus sp. EFPC2]|uniref:nicotinate phosphoribosyltransferase n=1 Tax=Methylococcus sp. EFPC2 TaxID=2812648 RepID=UPI0019679ECB|nr:nicotinate phosphoribosyltransferase [Methylococcus sp. EFPC2]QSA98180.1 nicotinate phosphoribosyltransferase [Methylococcus sp. EFPC2]
MLPAASALLTDVYQLTMLQAYYDHGQNERAAFEFFVRKLPIKRNFLVAAGLEQVLEYLETLRFTAEELDWLAGCGLFRGDFVETLANFAFTGDVYAMPEGTVCFPDEPLLRVEAPIREAQLVETRLINLLQYQTMVASKAARMALAAPGKLLVDFGLRRSHGAEAGLLAARAGFLTGLSGTATVLAGKLWGIPLYGTMAHSYVQAHDTELEAFEHFALSFPDACTWLIDTYDTEHAAAKLVPLAQALRERGIRVSGVRIDSGDLGQHARQVRHILDAGGLGDMQIFASGDLDEFRLADLVARAPIDGYGIGTRMNTSADAPYLDCAYKLQDYAGKPKRKRSEGKINWPGRKQVYRQWDDDGTMLGDVLTTAGDVQPGAPLLQPMMKSGRRLSPALALSEIRESAAAQIAALPEPLRTLEAAPPYPLHVAALLQALANEVDVYTFARNR